MADDDRSIPWRQRQELPCPVDPNCPVDHLRREKTRKTGKGNATQAPGSPSRGQRRRR